MMHTVYLARHGTHAEVGKVLSGRSDIELSESGRNEAAALAEHMSARSISAIYSSPRRRAVETAAIVADRLGLPVTLADPLNEIDFGEWTGRSFEALEEDDRWRDWNIRRSSGAAPGGETMVESIARARAFIEGIEPGEVLCVSHCDIIRGLVAGYLELPLDRLLAFDCAPASLTTLALGREGGRVISLNERPLSHSRLPV